MLGRLLPKRAPLERALSWIRSASVYSHGADWEALRGEARSLAERKGTCAALRHVVEQLGDRHAMVLRSDAVPAFRARWSAGLTWGLGLAIAAPEYIVIDVSPTGPAMREGVRRGDMVEWVGDSVQRAEPDGRTLLLEGLERVQLTLRRGLGLRQFAVDLRAAEHSFTTLPHVRVLGSSLAYLELPAVAGADADVYVTTAHREIARAERGGGTKGWIVDLRRNSGGDVYALLAAAGPLLGERVVGGLVDARRRFHPWSYRRGWTHIDDARRAGTSTPYVLRRLRPHIAVLISRRTASAGEALAIAFAGGEHVRSFGEPSFGVATGLEQKVLSDHTLIGISTSLFADRTRRTYETLVTPDVAVVSSWGQIEAIANQTIVQATEWLRSERLD